MKRLELLNETPIGQALIAYFANLPIWVCLNVAFAVALVPSLLAAVRAEFALALILSFPAALVMAGLIRLMSITVDGRIPRWPLLWTDMRSYGVVLSIWSVSVLVGLTLLTPLLYFMVVPALVLLLIAPLVACGAERLGVSSAQAWRNALVIAVHFPIIALGIVLLGVLTVWGVAVSGGALIIALPALWAAITVYTVDSLIHSLRV